MATADQYNVLVDVEPGPDSSLSQVTLLRLCVKDCSRSTLAKGSN